VSGHWSTVLEAREAVELRRRFTAGKPDANEKGSGTLLRLIAFHVCRRVGVLLVSGHWATVLEAREAVELRRRFTAGNPDANEKGSGTLLRLFHFCPLSRLFKRQFSSLKLPLKLTPRSITLCTSTKI
jgi:hypothetical protein